MKKEVIAFDKDGTLLNFDAFWVTVAEAAINELLMHYGMDKTLTGEILTVLGVKNSVTDIDGLLCHGTYHGISKAVHEFLSDRGLKAPLHETEEKLVALFNDNTCHGILKPTCENICEVLARLKDEGRTLIVVTTDNYEITCACLEGLGIRQYFDEIFTDDGITPAKPDPTSITQYLKNRGLPKESALMVGDTMTDVRFARNAGINVMSVGTSEENRNRLAPYADAVVADVSGIFDVLKELEE